MHPTNLGNNDHSPTGTPPTKPNWFSAMLGDVQFWIPFTVLVLSIVFLWLVK